MKRRILGFIFCGILGYGAQGAQVGAGDVATRPSLSVPGGASGVLEASGPGALSLRIRGLAHGIYELSAVTKADGVRIFLGMMSVTDPRLGPERRAGEQRKQLNSTHQTDLLETRSDLSLPRGMPATEIDRIVVTDLRRPPPSRSPVGYMESYGASQAGAGEQPGPPGP